MMYGITLLLLISGVLGIGLVGSAEATILHEKEFFGTAEKYGNESTLFLEFGQCFLSSRCLSAFWNPHQILAHHA